MNEAIHTRDSWRTAAMVLLAVLVLVVVALAPMLQPAATTDASTPAVHATITGGPGFAEDPYIDRHAEAVAGYRHGAPR
jgi:hypothetical protein